MTGPQRDQAIAGATRVLADHIREQATARGLTVEQADQVLEAAADLIVGEVEVQLAAAGAAADRAFTFNVDPSRVRIAWPEAR